MNRWIMVTAAAMALALPGVSRADRFGWSVGIRVGSPVAPYPVPRPYYGPVVRPYYYAPAPVVIAPTPVYVRPAPVFVQEPTVISAPPTYIPSASTSTYAPTYSSPAPSVAPVPQAIPSQVVPAQYGPGGTVVLSRTDDLIRQLGDVREVVRRGAAIELGRARSLVAVDPLIQVMRGDGSPAVREAAARGLGLISSPRALDALTQASQQDPDRDVRNAAGFAIEIVRVNSR